MVMRIAFRLLLSTAALAACQPEAEVDTSTPPRARMRRKQTSKEAVEIASSAVANESVPPPTLSELVDNGKHWRFATPNGPVHVWIPEGYKPRRAEMIIYVHGYYVNVDQAWNTYQLSTQFAGSGINAMFIACEAPSGPQQQVFWTSLSELLAAVDQHVEVKTPRRRIVTIGHSGAWRTLAGWLDELMIDTVVLLDAVYGELDSFRDWILGDPKRRLINVSDGTRANANALHAELPDTVTLDSFPTLEEGIPREAARARILHIKSNLGHFPLVTNGVALPMVLRALRAKRLIREPLAEILDRTGDP